MKYPCLGDKHAKQQSTATLHCKITLNFDREMQIERCRSGEKDGEKGKKHMAT